MVGNQLINPFPDQTASRGFWGESLSLPQLPKFGCVGAFWYFPVPQVVDDRGEAIPITQRLSSTPERLDVSFDSNTVQTDRLLDTRGTNRNRSRLVCHTHKEDVRELVVIEEV